MTSRRSAPSGPRWSTGSASCRRSCRSSPSTSGRSSWPMSRRTRRRSVFLAGWPSMTAPDDELLDDVAAVRRLVDLGRQARAASKLQEPAAAAAPRGRGARPRRPLRGRDRRRAAGEGGGLRSRGGHRAAGAPEPPRARPAPRRRARQAARGARGGRVRGARRGPVPGRGARARPGRGAGGAHREGGVGGRRLRRCDRRPRHRARRRAAPRGTGLRPDPPREQPPQGAGARPHGSHRAPAPDRRR